MDDFSFLNQTHQRLAAAALTAGDPLVRAHITELAQEAYSRAMAIGRSRRAEIVFDPFSAPGYVVLGAPGEIRIAPSPGLDGIESAWRILLEGAAAGHTLHVADLLAEVGSRPANALRNQLAKAAAWLELRSPHLARAIRSPCITISTDGGIRHEPASGLIVHLRAF